MEKQDFNTLLDSLSALDTDWRDALTDKIESMLSNILLKKFDQKQAAALLLDNQDAAITIFRLFLGLSKDEFNTEKSIHAETLFPGKKINPAKTPYEFIAILEKMHLFTTIDSDFNKKFTWKDILLERLRGGRGSAIKGQKRGADLEQFVENLISEIFPQYETRGSFVGNDGVMQAKFDFAIPSKANPRIIIEVKGYGATGSKQTDVIGDINKIINAKRADTHLILFTDGLTWRDRINDFRNLVNLQNRGFIYGIFTKKLSNQFITHLKKLKRFESIK